MLVSLGTIFSDLKGTTFFEKKCSKVKKSAFFQNMFLYPMQSAPFQICFSSLSNNCSNANMIFRL
jgi:hypothetical protein